MKGILRFHSKQDIMKGYKVSDAKRKRTVGVACQTLDELRVKGCDKLNIEEEFRIELLDGTGVEDEDYFQTLPEQTVLLFLKRGESASDGVEILYNALIDVNIDYLRVGSDVRKFFSRKVKGKVKSLVKIIQESETNNVQFSHKVEDPDWFEGINHKFDTKEKYMSSNSEGRIRNYMHKATAYVKKSDTYRQVQTCRNKLKEALKRMNSKLEADKYIGGYFDRSIASERLCDSVGNFKCKGRWDVTECRYKGDAGNDHMINPYASKETRIVFSTWTFDHVVEIRSIVPALLEAARRASQNGCAINAGYFYRLICTTENLKLVHIVCHDKGEHNAQCDSSKYTETKKETKKFNSLKQ
jgi:hypothetical protein